MTGPQQSTGKQIEAAVRLYMQEHGSMVAGKRIDLILKDDASVPEVTKRTAQDLIVNDKAAIIAGFGITPSAMVVAPLITEAKVPAIVMAAGTSIITERSPYFVRTSFTGAQSNVTIADWAARNGIRKVVTIVPDFTPGIENETAFRDRFIKAGGGVVESIHFPVSPASSSSAPVT